MRRVSGFTHFHHKSPMQPQRRNPGPARVCRAAGGRCPRTVVARLPLRSGVERTGGLDIYDYICAYGFCIEIDEAVRTQAMEIVNSKGNYYAYGRIGLIVVSPSKKLVLYMYNG